MAERAAIERHFIEETRKAGPAQGNRASERRPTGGRQDTFCPQRAIDVKAQGRLITHDNQLVPTVVGDRHSQIGKGREGWAKNLEAELIRSSAATGDTQAQPFTVAGGGLLGIEDPRRPRR